MKGYRFSFDKLFRSQLPKLPFDLDGFIHVQLALWGLIPCALFRVSEMERFNALLVGGFGRWFHRVFVLTYVLVDCQGEVYAYEWGGTGFDLYGVAYPDKPGTWRGTRFTTDP